MELHIQTDFDCVFNINGEFVERCDSLQMQEYDVVYVTVLPLNAGMLPYTVKLVATESLKTPLACGIRLSPEHYLLLLAPHYPVVYGCAPNKTPTAPISPITRLFSLIKNCEENSAYAMLTDNLKRDIDKKTLIGFFDGYERIAECSWKNDGEFYLIDKNGNAKLHSYTVKDGFIDDIVEK
ncbi:MAG: hypothetical protein HDT28_00040 [Clostridiales bacterium]|nr:hypothetical protein [Clostridiales bacterium]